MIFTRFEHRFVRISAVFPLIRAGHRQIADPHTFQQLYSIASARVVLVDSPRYRGFSHGIPMGGGVEATNQPDMENSTWYAGDGINKNGDLITFNGQKTDVNQQESGFTDCLTGYRRSKSKNIRLCLLWIF
jgi:hypothetical protein